MNLGFTTKVADPGTLPAGAANRLAFSPDGAWLAVVHATSPFITVYPWTGSGFGTKVADPGTALPGQGQSVTWSPDMAYIAIGHDNSPFVTVYNWSGSGFGTKVTNPATLPTSACWGVAFSPDGTWLAVAHNSAPRTTVWPWSAGFGTKVANPGTAMSGFTTDVQFSPDGTVILFGDFSSPYVHAYAWSSGFGSKFANPTTLPLSGFRARFSPDGLWVVVAENSSTPRAVVYPWSAGFGARLTPGGASPAVAEVAGTANGGVFSPDSKYLLVGHSSSPFVTVYNWTTQFGSKVTAPASIPATGASDAAFSPTGAVAVSLAASPYIAAWAEDFSAHPGSSVGTGAAGAPSSSVAVHPGSALGTGVASSPHRAIVPSGAPSYPLTLFRGAVIGVSADRDNGFLRLVLDCEDYNRQWALIHVGVPNPSISLHQPDGTEIFVDPDAQNVGIGAGDGGVVKHFVDTYWPPAPFTPAPDLSGVQNTNPDYSAVPIFDRQTATSTLDAILGEFVRERGSGASRFWVRPVGDDLVLAYRVVGLFDGLPDQRVPAPWALSTEGKAGTIMANIRADWDAHALRRRAYVRGGTPAACLYVENPGPTDVPTNAGDAFVDAPGALTRVEAIAVGTHHLRNNLREMLIAHVHVPPGHFSGATYVRNDGLEPGQSTLLSDEVMADFGGTGPDRFHPMLVDREAIIQTVRWHQVTSAPGTGIALDGVDLSDLVVAWEELSGELRYGTTPGKATIAVYLWDPDALLTLRVLADVKIWLDGTSDVEYDLEVGDVPAGDIAIQFDRNQYQAYTPPALKFTYVVSDPDMPVGGTSDVTITAARANYEPRDLAGLTVIPILLSWADAGETIPSDEYTLDDDGLPLVLNAVAQAYTVLRRVAGTTGFDHYKIRTVAAPKVEP